MPPKRPRRTPSPKRRGDRPARPASRPPRAPRTPARTTRDPYLGRSIAGYTIAERLATGPACITFKADQPAMGRTVTLEVLNDVAAADHATIARFYQTARFAAQVHHPNILSIYDVSNADNIHFCAMEYVQGRALGELLRARERFTSDDAIRVALDVAEALRAANRSGVPGLALSPDRVVLSDRGEVKLLLPTLADTAAPVLGDAYVLTAIGVLLYAMASGGRHGDLDDLLRPGSTAPAALRPIKRVAIGTRQDVAQVIDRLVGVDPGNPFPSLNSALSALRQLLEAKEQIETRARNSTARAQKRQKHNRLLLLVAILVVAVALAVVIGVLLHYSLAAGRVRRAFDGVHGRVQGLLADAERRQSAFGKNPSQQSAKAVVAVYHDAIALYHTFINKHADAPEATRAKENIRTLEAAIPRFWASAQRQITFAAVGRQLKALKDDFDAEVDRLKKTGGTLSEAKWRVRYATIIEQHAGARAIAAHVQEWVDALPPRVRRGQLEIDAQQLIRDLDQKYTPKDDYKGYIRAWDALHAQYRKFNYLTDRVTELHDTELNKAQRGANLAAFRLHERAGKLAKAGNVQGARALYNRIINHFGFESIVARAKEARDKLPSP